MLVSQQTLNFKWVSYGIVVVTIWFLDLTGAVGPRWLWLWMILQMQSKHAQQLRKMVKRNPITIQLTTFANLFNDSMHSWPVWVTLLIWHVSSNSTFDDVEFSLLLWASSRWRKIEKKANSVKKNLKNSRKLTCIYQNIPLAHLVIIRNCN